MYGHMRNGFFKYRKRKKRSLDGSVPGAEYSHFHRSTTQPLGSAPRSVPYHHNLYLGDLPSEYHPDINSPAVQSFDYEIAGHSDIPILGTTPEVERPPSFDPPEDPPLPFSAVEDDLAIEEQFLMNMGARPRPQEGPVPVEMDEIRHLLDGARGTIHGDDPLEADIDPRIADITEALSMLEDVLPEDHPDIVNLKAALEVLGEHGPATALSDGTDSAFDPIESDPIAEAQQIFDQQMLELDKGFELPAFMDMEGHLIDGFDEQQAALEHMLEHDQAEVSFMEQDGLEQFVGQADPFSPSDQPFMETEMMPGENPAGMGMTDVMPQADGYDMGMVHEEINQAINQVSGQTMPQGPMPEQPANHDFDPLEEDPWGMQRYMFDPQYMPNYMMPGPMPFGPMGPVQGP